MVHLLIGHPYGNEMEFKNVPYIRLKGFIETSLGDSEID